MKTVPSMSNLKVVLCVLFLRKAIALKYDSERYLKYLNIMMEKYMIFLVL